MPKSQNINPKVVRKPEFIEFGKIPVNQNIQHGRFNNNIPLYGCNKGI
jgi:hypothetical protein